MPPINWEALGKVINSRVGLVVLFMLWSSSPWGLGAKVDSIDKAVSELVDKLATAEIRNSQDHALLIRLDERQRLECREKELARRRTK